jgi:hypothetical protein
MRAYWINLVRVQAEGWTVVDMKNDWKSIFPFGSK